MYCMIFRYCVMQLQYVMRVVVLYSIIGQSQKYCVSDCVYYLYYAGLLQWRIVDVISNRCRHIDVGTNKVMLKCMKCLV